MVFWEACADLPGSQLSGEGWILLLQLQACRGSLSQGCNREKGSETDRNYNRPDCKLVGKGRIIPGQREVWWVHKHHVK